MIDDALYDAYGQRQISIMFTQLNQYRLVLEVKPQFKNSPGDLREIYIRPPGGGITPLSSFTRVEESKSPLAINHQGQFPVVTISFNLAPGVSLGDAVEAINRTRQELELPNSIVAGFQGTAEAFQVSLQNTPWLILAALVTVYIVLGVLYESYIHPITILSTLPSAGVGALVAMIHVQDRPECHCADRDHPADRHCEEERDHDDRLCPGCATSSAHGAARSHLSSVPAAVRPIMMTTMAALLGAVPLAIGNGVGSE